MMAFEDSGILWRKPCSLATVPDLISLRKLLMICLKTFFLMANYG